RPRGLPPHRRRRRRPDRRGRGEASRRLVPQEDVAAALTAGYAAGEFAFRVRRGLPRAKRQAGLALPQPVGRVLMTGRRLSALVCVVLVMGDAAWLAGRGYGDRHAAGDWTEVAPGVLRSPGLPAGYALVDGDTALLIDAPVGADGLRGRGVKKVE